ncbi:MAG: hypothetical protein JWR32_2221 [Mycobacterium sp.]|jgi:hypothetical protein|nr:hypothetical protein [Mycobacterium sp.]
MTTALAFDDGEQVRAAAALLVSAAAALCALAAVGVTEFADATAG